jgi:hypothetical protein
MPEKSYAERKCDCVGENENSNFVNLLLIITIFMKMDLQINELAQNCKRLSWLSV